LPLAFLLDFLGNFLVGLCAFWLESTAGLALIYTRSVMLLGGMLLPIGIYPEVLQSTLRILPFASMIYAPGRMFVDPSAALLADVVVRQGIAVVAFSGLTVLVQAAALKRLFANGG
jgi:ABC-2 type transport system permease protein